MKIVIDKESIIKVFAVAFYAVTGGDYSTAKEAVKELMGKIDYEPYEEQPTKGEWIPVSERLPEEGKSVLVCIETQGGMAQYVSERFKDKYWSALGGRTPIAWQPLPEPYKEMEK